MSIIRKEVPEPEWRFKGEYANVSTYDLFSSERWGQTVKWNILLEQAKKISNIVQIIDDAVYPSRLFNIYIDILEANLHVFDDIFYYLIGERITSEPFDIFKNIVKAIRNRLRFWNMDCYKEICQILDKLGEAENILNTTLYQQRFWQIRDELKMKGYHFDYPQNNLSKCNNATIYAYDSYFEKGDVQALANQLSVIFNYSSNIYDLFFLLSHPVASEDFSDLLQQFRESEKGKNYVNAWENDMNGTRDGLITKMEKDPKLGPWVNRYLHIRKDASVITQLFYNEKTGEVLNEEECYNTNNWINLLTVAAILKKYDERQKSSTESKKNCRRIKSFREFIKDAERTEEILGKLHRLIGNKTNADALKVIAKAMWIDWLDKPTATSIRNEFNTITCKDQQVSKSLKEPKPTHQSMIDKIKKEFEQA